MSAALAEALDSPDLMEPIQRLDRDLKAAAKLLGKKEARYLVDQYYIVQDQRIRDRKSVV